MTTPDPFVALPANGEPLLDFYRDTFDVAYVAVHPFFHVPHLDPLRCQYGTQVFERSEMPDYVDIIGYMDRAEEERSIGRPTPSDEVDAEAKRAGKIVAWRDMLRRCGLNDARAIDCALRTSIGGLRAEFADQAAADDLIATCLKEKIFPPTDTHFQPIMEQSIVSAFAQGGCDRIVLGDEFGDHDIPVALDFLRGDIPWDWRADWPQIYGVRRIYAVDRSMIAIVPWDHFFTVIAMTADCAARVRIDDLVEGFWCDEGTALSWYRGALPTLVGP